jgi:ComF family protein
MRQCAACTKKPPHIDAAYAAVTYGFPWAKLVHDFKFHDKPAWARSMASLMRSTPWVDPALDAADWVVPMPLSPERLRQRGFNQAYLLARALAPTQVRKDLLLRIRHTPPQSSLPRHERMDNVQHAFAIEPLQHHLLQGKRIVLVDDVMTSGASVNAAAQTFKQAGAQHVTALVFARTD